MIDWKPFLALAAALTVIAGALNWVYRAARGLSKREEAVELVPTLKSSVESLTDKMDALTAKLDTVASAAVMVPSLKETLTDQGHKLDVAKTALDRMERNQERMSNDLRAVEGNVAAVGRDVAEARIEIDWLKRRANGANHPGGHGA